VRPGLNGGGGTLNIVGSYTQAIPGTLYIDVNNGTTGLGVLNVQGQVDLGGTLMINRNPAYRPARGTSLTFLRYQGRGGTDFDGWTWLSARKRDPPVSP
jgi:hypothetical protein